MRWGLMFSCMLACYVAFPQDPEMVRVLEDQADRELIIDTEEDWQSLQQLLRRPLLLNEATAEDMAVFPFLTALHIEQFILYRKHLGPLSALEELQAVPGWEPVLIRKVLPYVAVVPPGTIGAKLKDDLRKADHQVLVRGSSLSAMLLRYRLNAPMIGANLTLEKDRGERWWQGKKGIAFASAHIVMRNLGLVRQWVVGDYLVNLGQGLLLWQGRGLYKSSMAVMTKKQQAFLVPYRSADENRFMRGSAIWLGKQQWQAMAFVSRHGLDANLVKDSGSGSSWVTAFQTSGLHRTEAEQADRDALMWTSMGGAVKYTQKRWAVGVHGVMHQFSLPILRRAEPYNLFAFSGRKLNGFGGTGSYSWRGIHAYGEIAWDGNRFAGIGGVMVAADRNLDFSVLLRAADRAYHAFGASAFMENEDVNNEKGVYLGLSWRPHPSITVDGYLDRFQFPWLRFRVNEPTQGMDQMVQITWKPDRQTRVLVRWKGLEKTENESGIAIVRKSLSTFRSGFRFHIEKNLSRQWEWRGRIELSQLQRMDHFRESGFMAFLECHWLSGKGKWAGNGRLSFFDTPSYDTRIYAYEPDVMYYSTIPASFGRGLQLFFNVRMAVNSRLNIFIKCSNVWKSGIANSYIRGQFSFFL